MSTATPPPRPAAAVIRSVRGAEESSARLLTKHVPAWVISGAVHVALIGTLIAIDTMLPPVQAAPQSDEEIVVVVDEPPMEDKRDLLTNPEDGIEPELPPAVVADKIADDNVEAPPAPEPASVPGERADAAVMPPPGVRGETGPMTDATEWVAPGPPNPGLSNRLSPGTKSMLLEKGGGSPETEAAVARGLVWLARKQKADGSWQFDGTSADDRVAATGLALLPFFAAGQTHKPGKDNKYHKQVDAGVKFLLSTQEPSGTFKGSSGLYSHAIGAVALCELFGMTNDRARLLRPAQAAINYIVKAQAEDGSWGYTPNKVGDTSIVGWQIQALHSAKLCKDLVVPKATFEGARKFLDKVAGAKKETYGYADRTPSLSLTPVGLLCRYYGDGWGPNNPGMAAGVKYVMDAQMPSAAAAYNMYYYYYATQVLHFFDGPEWHKQWNPAMRDLLLAKQSPQDKKDAGSWDPDASMMGSSTGRLGTTCLCLLTLEVYYRHLPLYKRDTAGMRELERAR